MRHGFEKPLIKIEDVLAKDPEYPEALFLKAQILWEGFEDRREAKSCLFMQISFDLDETMISRKID
ncbi:MAG: hypothetical protein P8185_07465 [Deltaproteobacteria bacterium]|jgi:hypothetical protein